MTIKHADWIKVSDADDLYYHDWTKAPFLVGRLERVVMKEDEEEVRYYVINCDDYSLRVYPYKTLDSLQQLDIDTCVRIDYQGTRRSRKGKHVYTVFSVYQATNIAKPMLGLYDAGGVLIDDLTEYVYHDDDPNKL